jgi:mono/diheme cytochrome c family protein
LPAALAVLGAMVLTQFRRRQPGSRPVGLVAAVLAVLAVAAVVLPVPLGAPATADDYNSFAAPPEWYVLPLHALLNLAQGFRRDLAFLGTAVIPGLAVLGLLLLPWLDRRRHGEPAHPYPRAAVGIGAAVVVILALLNVGHMAPLFYAAAGAPAVAPAGPVVIRKLDPALVTRGKTLFSQNGCVGCHAVGTANAAGGPRLDNEGRKHPDLDWQVRHLKAPARVVSGSTMPPFKHLSGADLNALANYLLSLKK